MHHLLNMSFRVMMAKPPDVIFTLIIKAQSKKNREVCVMPTGRPLLKCLSRLMPTNSRKMLMKLEKIQEGATEITEGLENMSLEKETKGFNLVY